MTGFDADMFYAETGAWHMHVSALLLLDPATARNGFGYEDFRTMIAQLAAVVPPLRERVVDVPFGLDRPLWVEDPHFDLDAHMHRIAVPAPGTDRELSLLVGDLIGFKLDRGRPLWDMWYIEGLVNGRAAVLTKIHHSAIDGVAGAVVMGSLLSTEPAATPAAPDSVPNLPPEPIPSDLELFARGLLRLAQTPVRAFRPTRKTLRSVRDLMRRRNSSEWGSPALPFSAPRTILNSPVGGSRSFAFTSVPLEDVKKLKDAAGVKVNDVVLAACAGALRSWLAARDALPDTPLVAACPVSTRDEAHIGEWGNMVSGLFATLATDLEDPVERLYAIHSGTEDAKTMYASGIEDAVIDWAEVPVPAFLGLGVKFYQRYGLGDRVPPIFNLLISNVPGPPVPLYLGGALLDACFPMGPVLDSIGLNMTVLSYVDRIGFGLVACPETVPDIWDLVDGIPTALEELQSVL